MIIARANLALGCHSADPVAKRIRTDGFPLADNLKDLLGKSRVSAADIESILAKHPGRGGLFALMSFALVQRVRKNGEMSPRYHSFLESAQRLIKDGRIRFEESSVAEDVDFNYDDRKHTISCKPEATRRSIPTEIIESSLIHELKHAYQYAQGRVMCFSRSEAEAHLAQSDFIWHINPTLLDESHWIKIFPDEGQAFVRKFLFPKRAVEPLALSVASVQQIDSALSEAQMNYLAVRLLTKVVLPDVVAQLEKGARAQNSGAEAKAFVIESLDRALLAVRTKPLLAHFSAGRAGEVGKMAEIRVSREVAVFSTTITFLVSGYMNGGKLAEAEKVLNQYVLDVWDTDLATLVNKNIIDPKV